MGYFFLLQEKLVFSKLCFLILISSLTKLLINILYSWQDSYLFINLCIKMTAFVFIIYIAYNFLFIHFPLILFIVFFEVRKIWLFDVVRIYPFLMVSRGMCHAFNQLQYLSIIFSGFYTLSFKLIWSLF